MKYDILFATRAVCDKEDIFGLMATVRSVSKREYDSCNSRCL